ncbi:MAG: hypothetical protein IKF09_09945 [Clostridiales bacterium]|nr:hypothetical protein [Clostridiales bacterium]
MSNQSIINWTSFKLPSVFDQSKILHFFIKPIFSLEADPSKGRLSELINGKNKGLSGKILEILAKTTKDRESGKDFIFTNYPYLKTAEKTWKEYIDLYPTEEQRLSTIAHNLCTLDYNIRISDKRNHVVFDLSEKLKETAYSNYTVAYQLAVLSILATTWPCWDNLRGSKPKKQDIVFLLQLTKMIFPIPDTDIVLDESNASAGTDDNVIVIYNNALALFEKGDYKESAELFTEIVTEHLTAPYEILANSYTSLIKFYGISSIEIPTIGTTEELKRWAFHYGANDIQLRSHEIRQQPQKSKAVDHGLYLFNYLDGSKETGQLVQWIANTKPDGWKRPDDWDFGIVNDLDSLAVRLSETPIRFILINKDYSQNLEDALLILDDVKTYQFSDRWDHSICENIEIIIRCPEEYATSMLDTACSFLNKEYPPVKIYLIDEKKRSADYLFSQHPLFYPMTFSFNKERLASAESSLIIVSNNKDTQYVSWLIRDAFWMLPHSSPKIHSRIIVMSPYASEIATGLAAECPGLTAFISIVNLQSGRKEVLKNPSIININDIAFPHIEFHPLSTNVRAFQSTISAIIKEDIFPYFVVDSESDLMAISLGKKIREILIRDAVSAHQLGSYSSDSTVIAIRSQSPDYAGLAQDLIVPKEKEHDALFFSDYKLITFGSIKDIFSWDQLTGGTIEFISQCMHMQYCSQSDDYDFNKEASTEDTWSYYHRLYNRAASFAAAMSLPYRLFEAEVYPLRWVISSDYNIYWEESSRQALAKDFSELLTDEKKRDELINRLARYEHTRWCCYMLSMGWLPASKEQTVHYMNNGVDRHTLQIAKMHPCICSWDDLKLLYGELHFLYNGAIDAFGKPKIDERYKAFKDEDIETFQKIDINNIKQTADILKAKPHPRKSIPRKIR